MDSTALLKQALDLYQQGEVNQAIQIWQSIEREDAPETYAKAQFNLGNTLREQGKIEGAIEAFQNSKTHHYYKAESYIKILICPKDTHENLKAIFNNTTNLLQKLHIKSDNTYEQKVAHFLSSFKFVSTRRSESSHTNITIHSARGFS